VIRDEYAAASLQLLVCGATVPSQPYLERLLAVIAADEHLVVRLEAEPETLQRRIVDREPPEWSGLPRLVAAAREIAAVSQSLERVDLVLSTEGEDAPAVADRIRALWPDVLLAR
jgi:hypothetical protein